MPKLSPISKELNTGDTEKVSSSILINTNAKGLLKIKADMDNLLLTDPKTEIEVKLEINKSGVWVFDAGFKFMGRIDMPLVLPGIMINVSEYAGKNIRLKLTPKSNLICGINLEY